MKTTFKENGYLFFIIILLALEAILFSVGNNKLNIAFINQEKKIAQIQNALANIPVQAKAVSIYDETSGKKIYGKNDEEKLPLASLTKIMTVLVALNSHNINDVIPVSSNAIMQEGDYGLFVNEEFNIKDLAEFSLIGSANDGAYAIAESTDNFLEKMNEKAQEIGMENAVFLNSTGLDINANTAGLPAQAGAYASAQDVNLMDVDALEEYPEVFSATVMSEITIKSESGVSHNIKNTDEALNKIPNILFSKTGDTPLAGGNLTIIYEDKYGHDIAITVLGSTEDGRFSDMEKIVNTLYNLNYGSKN
jgi:D-alanyl-D-alanine carboxypeptidase